MRYEYLSPPLNRREKLVMLVVVFRMVAVTEARRGFRAVIGLRVLAVGHLAGFGLGGGAPGEARRPHCSGRLK